MTFVTIQKAVCFVRTTLPTSVYGIHDVFEMNCNSLGGKGIFWAELKKTQVVHFEKV